MTENGIEQDQNQKTTRKVALITGITGQDGSYLAEFLLEKGYQVHGIIRRASQPNILRIQHLVSKTPYRSSQNPAGKVRLHYADLADSSSLCKVLNEVKPTEIYNLGAMSHVKVSFDIPEYSADVNSIGVLRMLEAIMNTGLQKSVRFYQASSSEMYGKVKQIPQTEETPFYPRSPYGVSKVYGFWITVNYREAYGIHASNGILFNHESPRRGLNFVTRKITRNVAKIHLGLQQYVTLGNLDSKRDWGHARDYIQAMWKMLQHETSGDYVVATNETHSIREFVEKAFAHVDMEIKWQGEGLEEIGVEKKTGITRVKVDEVFYRPTEVDLLIGSPQKAKDVLGWTPTTTFTELVQEMVETDIKLLKNAKVF